MRRERKEGRKDGCRGEGWRVEMGVKQREECGGFDGGGEGGIEWIELVCMYYILIVDCCVYFSLDKKI